MELYEIMRTAFSAREFTSDPLPDSILFKILDNARFAPSGGNRQGWRVIIVRDQNTKVAIAELAEPAAKRYAAQIRAGENPWNTIDPTSVNPETIDRALAPAVLRYPYLWAPVVLVVCVDLKVVASIDQNLERIGLVSGASIYPFVWNILLAASHEGYAGTIKTMPKHFAEFITTETSSGVLLIPQKLSISHVKELILIWTASKTDGWINRIYTLPL